MSHQTAQKIRTLLGRLARFGAVFLAVLVALDFAAPPLWGNRPRREGYLAFRAARDQHERVTVFVGSSRIFRQVDPTVFGPSAFNLGTPATKLIEQAVLIDRLLSEGLLRSGDLVVLEVQSILRPSGDEITSGRALYCQTLAGAWARLRVCRGVADASVAVSMPCFRYFKPGSITESLSAWLYEPAPERVSRFNALDDQADEEHAARREQLLAAGGSGQVRKRAANYRKVHRASSLGRQYRVPAEFLESLRDRCEAAGVRVAYLLPPLSDRAYGVARLLPEEIVIDLADPDQHPEFYDLPYLFDIGHLNRRGASLLSERLREELSRRGLIP